MKLLLALALLALIACSDETTRGESTDGGGTGGGSGTGATGGTSSVDSGSGGGSGTGGAGGTSTQDAAGGASGAGGPMAIFLAVNLAMGSSFLASIYEGGVVVVAFVAA